MNSKAGKTGKFIISIQSEWINNGYKFTDKQQILK